jgi:hypothetical protein
MTDIVDRLQDATDRDRIDDAISEITAIRAENERLRLLLEMSHKKFATLKAAYDMEMRKPIVLCGSAAPGGEA